MPHSYGYRRGTRDLFAKAPGTRGVIPLNVYTREYKLGDHVDIVVNSSIHRGMPYKLYHGKTGKIWNISKRAVGVVINKKVGNRLIPKRLSVRIEHVRPSKCQQEFKRRVQENQALSAKWKKEGGEKPVLKRIPAGPREATVVNTSETSIKHFSPEPYVSFYV